ncbi:NAD-dependent succinate-semialdehyde dehydrogenase [Kineococcus rhizosphaerae]|uniref:Succinate-semialdehyde dehydrogenase/glutarate-semialdehyde dehydrogenase n=1 Tax=Kineococcus rhizosphaerae TaxID=559628 RepID=A0A2T0QUV2_9ACTN|nr:NAD-dependent succinate-semialdehyde dehydrogenase [Kineococcus rhizosphaerae]PRY08926.1 succinate-semialdehyde dehydrogenase/glutarate-semialdehyde dehydrogenase [Kineococcus rhizosphaerae]
MGKYQVLNPATGKVENEFPSATDTDVVDALAAVGSAFEVWRTVPLAERTAFVRTIADIHEQRIDDLASIMTREMGKTTAEARGELQTVISIYRYYADKGPELLADTPLDASIGGTTWVRKAPVGALLGVMPWNYPFYQVARFVAPNLVAGNTILLKHASNCPESALAIADIVRSAGLPDGAYVNVFADNEQVARILADPRIVGVSVTGSERAGAAVASVAGQNLKKVVLELGGSDPFIVLSAKDLTPVVADAVTGRLSNGGQSCNGAKRFIVAEGLYDDFVEQFTASMAAAVTGDPTDAATTYGPLVNQAAVDELIKQIEDAVSKGATLRTGGRQVDREGSFLEPTVLTDVTPDMRAYHEELFGPVAVVHRVKDAAEAVTVANDSPFGLGAAVFSADEQEAQRVADQLDVGMVFINRREKGGADVPFGGTKRSGIGRELGAVGIDEFVNRKLMHKLPV